MKKKLSLEYIIRKPKTTLNKPPLLILLHGYGSNELDLFSFADELPDDLLIISARAPLTLSQNAYFWYTIHFDTNNGKFSDTDEALESVTLISNFIDEVKKTYDVNNENTFLVGFSQGTILSYAIALNHPEKVQHVVALSGYINQELLKENLKKEDYSNLDFFISHGSVDQVIPIEWAQNAPKFLSDLEIKYAYQEYIIGHGIAPQNFYDLKKWIQERI